MMTTTKCGVGGSLMAPKHCLFSCSPPPLISFFPEEKEEEKVDGGKKKKLMMMRMMMMRRRSLRLVAARLGAGNGEPAADPFPQAAIRAASLRFQESLRPDPLFIDPYAGCFLSTDIACGDNMEDQYLALKTSSSPCQYSLATKFIDDKLLSMVNLNDEVRQIVLLTDGMDTRPYRLNWPRSTLIFDISPKRVFTAASQRLQDVGARVAKNCMLIHIPYGSSDIQGLLCKKGFSGSRPSLWAIQGLPLMTLASFKEILLVVSSLTMKECIFTGQLPCFLVESEFEREISTQKTMDRIFMSNGFHVDVIEDDKVGRNLSCSPLSRDSNNILFVAQQLQFSDEQMERWRTEFQRFEEEGDEEGFEEL